MGMYPSGEEEVIEKVDGQVSKNSTIYFNEILNSIYSSVNMSKVRSESKLIIRSATDNINFTAAEIYTCGNAYGNFERLFYYNEEMRVYGLDIANKKRIQWTLSTPITKADASSSPFLSSGTVKWTMIY